MFKALIVSLTWHLGRSTTLCTYSFLDQYLASIQVGRRFSTDSAGGYSDPGTTGSGRPQHSGARGSHLAGQRDSTASADGSRGGSSSSKPHRHLIDRIRSGTWLPAYLLMGFVTGIQHQQRSQFEGTM
jgi:hypothetical protein